MPKRRGGAPPRYLGGLGLRRPLVQLLQGGGGDIFQRVRICASLSYAMVLAAGVCLLAGCHSGPSKARATIEFSRIPEANPNGQESQDIIEGFVKGAQPGERVVLY